MSFIAQVFQKLLSPKGLFTLMHERSCFWKHFHIERVNESLKLLKSAEKYLYPSFPSFWSHFCYKNLFLVRSDIFGLLVNTLTANDEYYHSNTNNLSLPLQMQLPKKFKTSFAIFIAFLESALNFEHFEKKKMSLIAQIFSNLLTPKNVFT